MNRVTFLVSIALLSQFILPITFSSGLASDKVNIFPPGSKPYGLDYTQHIANFWKWLISIPDKDNPVNDATGEKCANGQSNSSSPVFYLAQGNGGKAERICKVPAGKGLFIPVSQVELSYLESPDSKSLKDLYENSKADQDRIIPDSLYLRIDDKVYKKENITKYRMHTDGFDVVYPKNAIFGIADGGSSQAVADGFYIITEPLPKGNHTIQFKSLQGECDGCSQPFVQDVTDTIIAR